MSDFDPPSPPKPYEAADLNKSTRSELDDAKKAGMKLLTELKNFGTAASRLAVKTVKDVRRKPRS